MEKTKVGILGVGHLGRLHTSLYKEINSAEIAGIYDTNREKAHKVGGELGVSVFNEVDELLNQVDAVNIVTPTPDHFNSAEKALSKDCHLFIEKPITDSVEQAEKIIQLAKEKNKILQVGHIERFNPALLALDDVKLNPIFIECFIMIIERLLYSAWKIYKSW